MSPDQRGCVVWRFYCSDARLYQKQKSVLKRKFKPLQKGCVILPDKFDVAAITSFATIDSRGNITIPSEIIYEMFGTIENAAGTELRVHWNRENNSITIKKIGKNRYDGF